MSRFFAHLSVLSVLLVPSQAFWILGHDSLTQDRLDPIVSPGQVSGHVHNIIGASNFGPEVSFESLTASNCTTSPVQADMRLVLHRPYALLCTWLMQIILSSSYWAPQLYYHDHSTNTFTLVPIAYVQTYCMSMTWHLFPI